MKGNGKILLAWGLLLAIPLLGFFLQIRLDRLCTQIDGKLENSRNMASPQELEEASALWLDRQILLTTLVTHEEVDAVTLGLRRALAFLYADNPEEFYAAIEETAAHLRIVRQFDKITIRSVF